MNPSMRHVRAFQVLAQEQNFTRAAEVMHLSQPAFSALISGLEHSVGLKLFHRSTRNVSLTQEGSDFVEPARRLLAQFEQTLAGLRDSAQLKRGRVSVALLPSLAAHWLPSVIADFHAKHPAIHIEVFDVLSDTCISLVAAGQADFAIGAATTDNAHLASHEFCQDDYYLVCPKGHPLATKARLRIADLGDWPFVHLVRSSSVRQSLEAALHPIQTQVVMEVEQLATVMGMVRANLGISVVPGLTLGHFDQPGIVIRRLPVPGWRRTLYIVRPKDREPSVAARALLEAMLKQRGLLKLQ